MTRHWSFEPKPDLKGSYQRRIEVIHRALAALGIDKLNEPAKFIAYFFGCEKFAHAIVGIERGVPAEEAYGPSIKIDLFRIRLAVPLVGLTFPPDDLQFIFADYKRRTRPDPQPPSPIGTSARMLRNDVIHDFGPTNVGKLGQSPATVIVPKMVKFLACTHELVSHLKRTWP